MRTILLISLAAAAVFVATAPLGGLAPASLQAAEPQKAVTDPMQGTWTIESFTLNGNDIDAQQMEAWRRIVDGNRVTWKNGEETMIELEIKYDAKATPHTLDSTIKSGESSGKTLLAIYELKDDTLKVCFGHPGNARPKDFSSRPDSGQSLYVAKRVKK